MKKLIAVMLSAATVFNMAASVFASETVTTFNVGKHAAAFAYGSVEGTKTSYAVDDDTETSWISANTNADYRDYLVLDLGASYSIDNLRLMPAEGTSCNNFTVYGAASADGAKTAITEKVTTLVEGEFTTVATIDSGSYRFITLEQDAEETDFGFAEIEINTQDAVNPDEHVTGGPAQPFTINTGTMWYVNYAGYANGNGGRGDLPNMTDADPATMYNLNCFNPQPPHAMIMADLGEAKQVSHLVYQGVATDSANGSGEYDHINNFKIVASNDSDAYLADGEWEVVATVSQPTTYLAGDGKYDTGLMVFDVASIIGETPYRYYGLVKTDKLGAVWRMSCATLQLYERVGPPIPTINVATDKAAMAYSSAPGTTPAYAVDGDTDTYWESLNHTEVLHDNLVIDLGAEYSIDSISVTLANENSAKDFSVYGSRDIKEYGKTKLCDVTDVSTGGSEIYSAGTGAYRYIIFDKAPSASPLAFAEIEVYAPAVLAGEACKVSLISEGKSVMGSTYQEMNSWDVNAEKGAPIVDNNPETRFSSSVVLTNGRMIAYFVDLGDSFPVSHVVYQGTDRGDYNPVNNENDSMTGYKIVGTNTAPTSMGAYNINNYTLLAEKTGYPYVGERIESNLFGNSAVYDTGLTIMPVDGGSYRYIGIIKDHSEDGSTTARLGVNTLQVYAKAEDLIDYVTEQGAQQLISSESGNVTEDAVSYQIDMLNAGESYAVTGLFANAQDAAKTAYADGKIPMAGAYGSLALSAAVTDGLTGSWDLVMLRGLKAIQYIQNVANPKKVTLSSSTPSGSISFVQSGLTGTATGTANAEVLGMLILKPGADKDDFSSEDIYYHMLKPIPGENEESESEFTFRYTFGEEAEAGDYTVVFFSENGIFSDKAFRFTMHPVAEIKSDFATITAENFMTNVQKYPDFFSAELVNELVAADEAEGSSLPASFMLAKSGFCAGLFDSGLTDWNNANTIASAVKASLIIENSLRGKDVKEDILAYGDAIPAVFESPDFDPDDFCELLPSVMEAATITEAEDLLDEYNRTIALALIANGSLLERETALKNYATELGIESSTLDCGYTLRAIADELSTSMSVVKASYADGMDDEVKSIIKQLSSNQETGRGSGSLGGSRNSGSAIVPAGNAVKPAEPTEAPGKEATSETVFSDLAGYDWAKSSIYFLVNRKIIVGVGDNLFAPDGLLNREQATKLLILSLNLPTEEHKNGFKDCVYGSWYYPYITSAQEHGIVKGISNNVFGIGESVTRQDLMVMIYRAISKKLPKSTEAVSFTDDALIADYAKDAVSTLASLGIITGNDDGSFAPAKTATRAEASVIFARLIDFIETYEEEAAE